MQGDDHENSSAFTNFDCPFNVVAGSMRAYLQRTGHPIILGTDGFTSYAGSDLDPRCTGVSVEVRVTQTDPLQVNAIMRGNLNDSCTNLGHTQTTYADDTFWIKLVTITPSDRGCVQNSELSSYE